MKFIVKKKIVVTPAKLEAPKKISYEERLAARNKKWTSFIFPLDLWNEFIESCCQHEGPGYQFTRYMKDQIAKRIDKK